jgi:hypothetical protein
MCPLPRYARQYSSGGKLLQTIAVATRATDESISSVPAANGGRFVIAHKSQTSAANGGVYMGRYFADGALSLDCFFLTFDNQDDVTGESSPTLTFGVGSASCKRPVNHPRGASKFRSIMAASAF